MRNQTSVEVGLRILDATPLPPCAPANAKWISVTPVPLGSLSVEVSVTVALVLFQPAALGRGESAAVVTGGVVSEPGPPTNRLFTTPALGELTVKPAGKLNTGPLVGKLIGSPKSMLSRPKTGDWPAKGTGKNTCISVSTASPTENGRPTGARNVGDVADRSTGIVNVVARLVPGSLSGANAPLPKTLLREPLVFRATSVRLLF